MKITIDELRHRTWSEESKVRMDSLLKSSWKAQDMIKNTPHEYVASDFEREYWMPDIY